MLIRNLLIATLWFAFAGGYDIKVGLVLPKENVALKPTVGFGTTAGAITLALQRIKEEKLLEGANFT